MNTKPRIKWDAQRGCWVCEYLFWSAADAFEGWRRASGTGRTAAKAYVTALRYQCSMLDREIREQGRLEIVKAWTPGFLQKVAGS